MGGVISTDPGVTVEWKPSTNPDESPVYINSIRVKENGGPAMIHYTYRPDARTVPEIVDGSVVIYGNNDAFGEREVLSDNSLGSYVWIKYKQFREMCLQFAGGLQAMGLKKGDKVGVYSVNCTMWQVAQIGAQYIGCVPVPIYDSLGRNAASYIASHSECKVIVTHIKNFDKAYKVFDDYPDLQKIISISDNPPIKNEKVITIKELMEIGSKVELVRPKVTADDIAMIMYTNGSTGKPKGCVLTHEGIMAGGNGLGGMGTSVTQTDTYFSFLPLAHVYELCSQTTLICQGARTGFYAGDLKKLIDDMQILKPTIMCGVPRIFNRVYDAMQNKIAELQAPIRLLVNAALKHKNACLLSGKRPSMVIDNFLLSKFTSIFGGRLRLIVNGGAPILPHVYEFCRAAITPNIIQGYGLTEIGAAGCVQQCGDPNPDTVGPVAITVDMKLRKIPEMKYDPRAECPSGEIMYKGRSLFKEYYKDPELTAESLIDGWFATGDVGLLRKDGTIQIIDRVKQLVKLSQGEYISITNLTNIYGTAKDIVSIYVYANSTHDRPIAVVVPDPKLTEELKNDKDKIKEKLISNLDDVYEMEKLRGFEKLGGIVVYDEPFTIENGLLTPSQKIQINAVRNKFEEDLNKLYDTLDSAKRAN